MDATDHSRPPSKANPSVRATLRVGAVSYLNTKPLVYGLEGLAHGIELIYDLPSRLADALYDGQLDVALIPSIELLRHPGYSILSDACIGCHGPVLSVKLLSRCSMSRIESLALDEGSRSSAVLARILLRERFSIEPELRILPHGADPTDAAADAILLIGDRAIHPPTGIYLECWDLGDQWCRWAELPFVFAMWVARPGVESPELESALGAARDAGLANLEEIARCEAGDAGLSQAQTLHYLRDNLHFYLGPREQRGLRRFYRYAADLGIEFAAREERLHDCETPG